MRPNGAKIGITPPIRCPPKGRATKNETYMDKIDKFQNIAGSISFMNGNLYEVIFDTITFHNNKSRWVQLEDFVGEFNDLIAEAQKFREKNNESTTTT